MHQVHPHTSTIMDFTFYRLFPEEVFILPNQEEVIRVVWVIVLSQRKLNVYQRQGMWDFTMTELKRIV